MTAKELARRYRRLLKHGVREPAPYPELEKDCLIWPWRKNWEEGRAMVCVDGRGDNAARVLWKLFRGSIPNGLCICHHCDNPSCVELTHLFMGTHGGNAADRDRKGRAAKGETNSSAKLTENQVREILKRYVGGRISQKKLAAEYGVSDSTISYIVRHKNWKHIRVRKSR